VTNATNTLPGPIRLRIHKQSPISIVILAGITPQTPQYIVVAMLAIHCALRSLQSTAIGTLAYLDVPRDRMSCANGFLSGTAQLSSGMGVALGAVLLHTSSIRRGASDSD
jgi:hypothetical protein